MAKDVGLSNRDIEIIGRQKYLNCLAALNIHPDSHACTWTLSLKYGASIASRSQMPLETF